ncbi:MAG: amidohydrolase family protein [Chloroflexi bacterium]|nr:amidohydrolase family protein [Chloroflexota bacterium]
MHPPCDTFGPQRMMWGSDYPPVGDREGYRNSLQGVLKLPLFKTQEEKARAFGKTAAKACKLD